VTTHPGYTPGLIHPANRPGHRPRRAAKGPRGLVVAWAVHLIGLPQAPRAPLAAQGPSAAQVLQVGQVAATGRTGPVLHIPSKYLKVCAMRGPSAALVALVPPGAAPTRGRPGPPCRLSAPPGPPGGPCKFKIGLDRRQFIVTGAWAVGAGGAALALKVSASGLASPPIYRILLLVRETTHRTRARAVSMSPNNPTGGRPNATASPTVGPA